MMSARAAKAVLDREVRRLFEVPEEVPIEELPEPARTYVTYACATVDRGRKTFGELQPYVRLKGARHLDAGCAYGGFLVAAAEAGAREVVGLELDERLVKIARPFVAAHGFPHRIDRGDAADPAVVGALGQFDLITCSDVIEHVDDVPRSLATLASALAEGGSLYMAIPNRRSPQFIRSDPHFQLFGIVLLPRPSARRYHFAVTAWPHYDVGDYFELDEYRSLLEGHGLTVEVINEPTDSKWQRARQLSEEYEEIESAATSFSDSRLPEDLVLEVREAVARAVGVFRGRLGELLRLDESGQPEAAEAAVSKFLLDFAPPVWQILARRPAGNGKAPGNGGGLFSRLARKFA
jgi:SAM-dependent methyltransferase